MDCDGEGVLAPEGVGAGCGGRGVAVSVAQGWRYLLLCDPNAIRERCYQGRVAAAACPARNLPCTHLPIDRMQM